jgi:hypothetical protein
MPPNELFLSYSSLDHAFASSIVDVLRHHGIPMWHSEHLDGGQPWHDEIGKALRRCDWFAVIVSPRSADSMWVRKELNFALRQPRLENRILPLVYESCDLDLLSWTLLSVQMIDFTVDFHSGCRALLRTWGLGYKQI